MFISIFPCKILTRMGALCSVIVFLPLADSFAASGRGENSLKCLALNIYHECRGESRIGQVGVGMVTLNRVKSGLFQPTVCGVVYAQSQFSWTSDNLTDIPKQGPVWNETLELAKLILAGKKTDPTQNASHYFNPHKVQPVWASRLTYTVTLGNHKFFRQQGMQGSQKHLAINSAIDMNMVAGQGQPMVPNMTGAAEESIEHVNYQSGSYENFLRYIDELPDAGE